jgi:hypothetical protein
MRRNLEKKKVKVTKNNFLFKIVLRVYTIFIKLFHGTVDHLTATYFISILRLIQNIIVSNVSDVKKVKEMLNPLLQPMDMYICTLGHNLRKVAVHWYHRNEFVYKNEGMGAIVKMMMSYVVSNKGIFLGLQARYNKIL